jgi:hypothetical protein
VPNLTAVPSHKRRDPKERTRDEFARTAALGAMPGVAAAEVGRCGRYRTRRVAAALRTRCKIGRCRGAARANADWELWNADTRADLYPRCEVGRCGR